ncbi:MAG: ABC transporter ATP-binding protein [Acetobacteraceae bacterium]
MLRVEGAGRRFASGTVALEAASLGVEAGDFIALLGPSGCGKSTLLRLIAGLDQPDGGRIVWDSAPGDIGFVFQDPTLLPWATAAENVRLPLRLRGRGRADAARAAAAALARVGLAGFEAARPRQLSGGMRMRVSIARSLVVQPKLLLMDEPFAALDEFTRHALQDDVRRLWASAGCSVVFVTHSIYEAAYLARRIVIMSPRPGRIVREIRSTLADAGDRRLDPAYAALVAEVTAAMREVAAA